MCLLFSGAITALADPGPLAQSPILTSAASAPNILIVVDDSGSMGWRRSGQPKRPMQQAQDAARAHAEDERLWNEFEEDYNRQTSELRRTRTAAQEDAIFCSENPL